MLIYQILAICGMVGPIVYTAMWVIIGSYQKDYDHVRDDISKLFAVGAPYQRISQAFMIASSVLILLLFLGLHGGISDGNGLIIGPILFIISSILGVLVAFFFPLDEGGEMVTKRGKMHLTLVVLSGILTIIGMIFMFVRLILVPIWSIFAIYSLVTAIISLVLVMISGKYATTKYKGITERMMVTPYELYYFVLPYS